MNPGCCRCEVKWRTELSLISIFRAPMRNNCEVTAKHVQSLVLICEQFWYQWVSVSNSEKEKMRCQLSLTYSNLKWKELVSSSSEVNHYIANKCTFKNKICNKKPIKRQTKNVLLFVRPISSNHTNTFLSWLTHLFNITQWKWCWKYKIQKSKFSFFTVLLFYFPRISCLLRRALRSPGAVFKQS